jgi:hypothetical protein
MLHQPPRRRLIARHGQFLQISAGDEHARFAAPEDEPLQILALVQLPEELLELAEHGLIEGVGSAIGLVECDQGNTPVQHFPFQGGFRRFA